MFKAIIVACHIANPNNCIIITDERGPYDTEEKCQARIEEMIHDSISIFLYKQWPMIFKLTSCVHPDDMEFTNVGTNNKPT
jgi:hypothetical protein